MHRTTTVMALFVGLCAAAIALAQSGQNQPSPGPNPDQSDARGSGMGRSDQGTGAQDRAGGGMTGDGATHAGARINAQIDQQFEQDFVKHAYSGNQFEVQLGQLVNDKAQDAQVKRIAQRLVDDHRQANDQLKQVAQQMNVQLSNELMPVHQAKLQQFQEKQGNQLELGFVFDQIGDHTTEVLKYQFVAQNAQNPQLKQYAAQCVPKLREHAQMLMQIAPAGTARTAGERIPPMGGSDHGTPSGGTSGTGGGRTGDR